MFSLQDLPVQLDAMSFAEMGPAAAFSSLPASLNGETGGNFKEVLAQLQQLNGEISLENFSENPDMLSQLGVSQDHLELLQQLMADGKNLPEAAETVLFDIKKQISDLLSGDISTDKTTRLEMLQQEMSTIKELLPENLQADLQGDIDLLSDAIDKIKAILEEVNLTAQQNKQPEQAEIPAVENIKLSSAEQKAATYTEPDAKPVSVEEILDEVAQQPIAGMAMNTEQQKQADKPSSDKPVQPVAAVTQSANPQAKPSGSSATIFQDEYAAQAESEYELTSHNRSIENKVMPNIASQQATGRVNQLNLHEHALASQAAARISGDTGTGSSGMQSNGGNTSYTQLMTQSTPQPITQNIHKPEWGNAVGQRITWMIGNKLQGAQLRITPAHLGPVDIKLSIESGVAQVSFVSNHQVVRDALEQAVPRLRDMLESQDLELGDVDISDHNLADSQRTRDESSLAHQGARDGASGDHDSQAGTEDSTIVQTVQSDGLLDMYA